MGEKDLNTRKKESEKKSQEEGCLVREGGRKVIITGLMSGPTKEIVEP